MSFDTTINKNTERSHSHGVTLGASSPFSTFSFDAIPYPAGVGQMNLTIGGNVVAVVTYPSQYAGSAKKRRYFDFYYVVDGEAQDSGTLYSQQFALSDGDVALDGTDKF